MPPIPSRAAVRDDIPAVLTEDSAPTASSVLALVDGQLWELLESSPAGVAVSGSDGTFVWVNDACAGMLGYDIADLIGAPYALIQHADDRDADEALLRALDGDDRRSIDVERRYRHADGHVVHAKLAVRVVRDHVGQPAGFLTIVQDVSPHRDAEQLRQAAEARYRRLFADAPIGQALVSVDGIVIEANANTHRILGYPDGGLLGLDIGSLTYPDDWERSRRLMQEIVEGRRDSYQLEKRYLRRDGDPVWVQLSVAAVRDAHGNLEHFIGLLADIDDRKREEDALRGAERHFREVFAHTPVGLVVVAPDGSVEDANPALCRIVGRRRADLVGADASALVLDGRDGLRSVARALVDQGHARGVDWRLARPDGAIVHVRVSATRVGGRDTERYVAIVEDTTEQRRAEWQREVAEQRLRSTFEDAAVGQVITTLSGHVVEANQAFAAMVGLSSDALAGRHLGAFTDDEPFLSGEQVDALLLGDADHLEFERDLVLAGGRTVHTLVSVTLGMGLSGGPEHFLLMVQDVTQRRRAEERLAATLAALEERNADLEHFASAASHDLKTPLQTVLGFMDLLRHEVGASLEPVHVDFLDRAIGGAMRMAEMIDAILTFARSGTAALELRPVALDEVVERVRAGLTAAIDDAAGELAVGDLPTVVADADALDRILQNLIANALKFHHPERPCRIAVDASSEEDGWTIRVADNGPGIPPESRDRVFQMFERLPASQPTHGAGIGLSTCQRLVERHGGRIWVEDTPGGGATFALYLPGPA